MLKMKENKDLASFYCVVNNENKMMTLAYVNYPMIMEYNQEDLFRLNKIFGQMIEQKPEIYEGCRIIKLQEVSE
jgi:hypothetical protein